MKTRQIRRRALGDEGQMLVIFAGGLVLHGLVLIGRGLRERRRTGAPAGA